jgi:cobalt-precorrin 5A hydrolase
MTTAIITLSEQGARVARVLAAALGECRIYLHEAVPAMAGEESFPAVVPLTARIFQLYRNLVYIAPCGAVVRAIAPLVDHKLKDPAVVVVDVGHRWAVSLLSGHEGGANDLALAVGNALAAEPVITTTTEAAKTLIVGIGCRRGTPAETLMAVIREGLQLAGGSLAEVRYVASAQIKSDEPGLIDACAQLGIPLRFITEDAIRACSREFDTSAFVTEQVNMPAVAEPSALLAGTRTSCILNKTILRGATIAIARENCW